MVLHIEVEFLDTQISVFILTHIVVLAHFDGKYTNFFSNSQGMVIFSVKPAMSRTLTLFDWRVFNNVVSLQRKI